MLLIPGIDNAASPTQSSAAYAAVIAAGVTGGFALLQLVISKENKVSEFRQAWIDALRADLARYASAVSFIAQIETDKRTWSAMTAAEHANVIQGPHDSAATAQASILMRLNPDDKEEATLRLAADVRAVRALVEEFKYEEAREKAFALIDVAQPVLRAEWKRVKEGEAFFGTVRFIFLGVFLSSLGLLVLLLILRALQ